MTELRIGWTAMAPLLWNDIDTDAILPVPYLKDPTSDLGVHLFHNLRYDEKSRERSDFVLNHSDYRDAEVLLTKKNFGCGSSREHAVWALQRFGIRCVIAQSFGDIFFENCLSVGLLPAKVSEEVASALEHEVERQRDGALKVVVELNSRTIETETGSRVRFHMEESARRALLRGSAMGSPSSWEADIERYERQVSKQRGWLHERHTWLEERMP